MSANSFVTLTPPVGNGSGAAVDVSQLGAGKTIVVGSSGGVYEPITTVEASQDGISWAPLASFTGKSERNVVVACKYMRQTVGKFVDGSVPAVGVGAATSPVTLTTLDVPAGNGFGAPSTATGLQSLKSMQVGGDFRGTINIQISDDGGVTYDTVASFSPGGVAIISEIFTADHVRVHRTGVPTVSPGLPTLIIADNPGGGGGGGGASGQVFRYAIVVGDTGSSSVAIGAAQGFVARANTNYNVQVTQGEVIDNLSAAAPPSLYLTTGFTLKLSAAPQVGDTFLFTVQDLS